MRIVSCLFLFCLFQPFPVQSAPPKHQAALDTLLLLRDTHHALVCKLPPFENLSSQERDIRTVKLRTGIGRVMISSGFDTLTLIKVNEAMHGMSDCEGSSNNEQHGDDFWNPLQQRALYCLSQDERVARQLAAIGAEEHPQAEVFIRHFEARMKATEPGIFKRLCEESKQHKGS